VAAIQPVFHPPAKRKTNSPHILEAAIQAHNEARNSVNNQTMNETKSILTMMAEIHPGEDCPMPASLEKVEIPHSLIEAIKPLVEALQKRNSPETTND
jgi:hypothetical protein